MLFGRKIFLNFLFLLTFLTHARLLWTIHSLHSQICSLHGIIAVRAHQKQVANTNMGRVEEYATLVNNTRDDLLERATLHLGRRDAFRQRETYRELPTCEVRRRCSRRHWLYMLAPLTSICHSSRAWTIAMLSLTEK
ncbi:hypothetical protein HDV57DRAFT_496165 [Trichoderma longibrachiatum]